jgi:glyoxylase-like metal-dependent hydrolase (beta-lactamase superfamily II)
MTSEEQKIEKAENEQWDYLFEQFRVPRGCLGYVIADSETRLAAIVDPELEMVEPVIDFVFAHGLRPAYVIDTHTHADHVSGARALKTKTVARLVMHEKAPSSAVDIRVEDGDRLYLGTLPLKFLHTPGHAKDLISVLLPGKVLTADALLIGSCGRTDLLNGSAVRQYHTLYHTYNSLPDDLGSIPATTTRDVALPFWATRSGPTPRCSLTPRRSSSSIWISRIRRSSNRSSISRRRSRRT